MLTWTLSPVILARGTGEGGAAREPGRHTPVASNGTGCQGYSSWALK
jgi:hypothetical protein